MGLSEFRVLRGFIKFSFVCSEKLSGYTVYWLTKIKNCLGGQLLLGKKKCVLTGSSASNMFVCN